MSKPFTFGRWSRLQLQAARPGKRPRVATPEQRNYAAIERLEGLLGELRANPSTARETEAIREAGLEVALAVREIGAMLVDVGWEQSHEEPQPPPDEP